MSPFLTQIDSRAAVRGSRDPLSLVPIWSAFGRKVVGNLTTASTSLRGFTTLLIGYYCAEKAQQRAPDETLLNVFLRAEQLISYSRTYNGGDKDYRGSERVIKRLDDSSKITLSAKPQHQILGDQKTYGLWGLYSVASRTSGLLLPDKPMLTPKATEFVERNYIQRLKRAGLGETALLAAVTPATKDLDLSKSAKELSHVLARLHSKSVVADEREFYQQYLVDGGDETNTDGQQKIFSALLDKVDTEWFGMADLRRVIRLAEKTKQPELAARLAGIERLEKLITAAASLFGFLLKCDSRPLKSVASDVRQAWGTKIRSFDTEMVSLSSKELALVANAPESAAHLLAFGERAAAGDWSAAISSLVTFNAFVMHRRGGAPWLRIDNGVLKVHYREEGGDLAEPQELESPWQSTYFINSLHGIKLALGTN